MVSHALRHRCAAAGVARQRIAASVATELAFSCSRFGHPKHLGHKLADIRAQAYERIPRYIEAPQCWHGQSAATTPEMATEMIVGEPDVRDFWCIEWLGQ